MRENGLQEAIAAAGGVNALGRLLEVSGQAVQQWKRIPAERVIQIERKTGVPRERLRPDLYMRG